MADYLNFDHAAATTIRPEVWQTVEALKSQALANPSAVHALGRSSKGLIDEARIELAELMLVKPAEIIFTSGATEALVTAIVGGYLGLKKPKGVVYTSPLVHSCVWAGLNYLQTHHHVEIRHLPILPTGHLDLESIDENLIAAADMVVTEHLNSEIGTLQPVAKLGKKLIRWADETRNLKPVLVVDAAASAVSELVGLEFQKCDFLALSAEKIGGISGTGVLLKKEGRALAPLIGGSQEWGWRGGTENIVGIASFAAAYKTHLNEIEARNQNLKAIGNELRKFLTLHYPDFKIITPQEGSGAHILTLLSPSVPAEFLVAQADLAGVALSAGSACSSGSNEGSKVLLALGYPEAAARGGLRFSWGWDTQTKAVELLKTRLESFLKV